MKLGKKGKDVETFVDKLVAEGESKCRLQCLVSLFDDLYHTFCQGSPVLRLSGSQQVPPRHLHRQCMKGERAGDRGLISCSGLCFSIHLRVSEKMTLVAGRDGGLQNMEIVGLIMLRIADPEYAKVKILLDNSEKRAVQFQVGWFVCACTHVCMHVHAACVGVMHV